MRAALTRYSDIGLAALVIGIVGMMIVPLPTFVLDMLLTLNFTIAVTLLMVSLYIPDALKISAFPSILLITTLFRLALNVSSTRLILLQADAGQVIASFGNFVVQGNYVVGAVIFLILTLIQFLVIAKGAERVSEVGARFTLDAMPGKQMSIDADLRAGAFDLDEARRRRNLVQKESKLYGAMDGAMKFVKGDAIAGVIMTAINITAGIIIGVLQRDMPVTDAAQTYTLLTIGDGLVSQIPALLIATTAGIIVTRVSSEDEDMHLGGDIFGQLMAQPKALAITAALLVGLGAIPGLPVVPFFLMAIIVGSIAYGLFAAQRMPADDLTEEEEARVEQVTEQAKESARHDPGRGAARGRARPRPERGDARGAHGVAPGDDPHHARGGLLRPRRQDPGAAGARAGPGAGRAGARGEHRRGPGGPGRDPRGARPRPGVRRRAGDLSARCEA